MMAITTNSSTSVNPRHLTLAIAFSLHPKRHWKNGTMTNNVVALSPSRDPAYVRDNRAGTKVRMTRSRASRPAGGRCMFMVLKANRYRQAISPELADPRPRAIAGFSRGKMRKAQRRVPRAYCEIGRDVPDLAVRRGRFEDWIFAGLGLPVDGVAVLDPRPGTAAGPTAIRGSRAYRFALVGDGPRAVERTDGGVDSGRARRERAAPRHLLRPSTLGPRDGRRGRPEPAG